jgi:DNA topoisomerase I
LIRSWTAFSTSRWSRIANLFPSGTAGLVGLAHVLSATQCGILRIIETLFSAANPMCGVKLGRRVKSIPLAPTDPLQSAKFAGLRYVTGEGPSIVRRRAGKGFSYLGVDSKPVRDKATLKRIRSLVIPPAWEHVWICPVENAHLGPFYRKFAKKCLATPGLPRRKVIAAIVRLLDETCIRIGNDEYAKSNESYGLTTLKEQHVDVHGDNVRRHFRGKSKQDHDIKLRDRRLAKIVKQLQDLPGQELFQYREENGEYVKVDSAHVNDYLRDITEDDFTAKDFRT